MSKPTRPLWQRYLRFLRDVVVETWKDDLPLLAAALAHFAFLSLIPLLLVAMWVGGTVLKNPHTFESLCTMLTEYVPVEQAAIQQILGRLVNERSSTGGIGIVALIWISMRIFVTLQRALDRIWNISHEERRHPVLQWLIAVPTVLAVGIVALFSTVVTPLVASLQYFWPAWFSDQGLPPPVKVASATISVALSVVLMFLIYRLLPTKRPRTRSALPGAIVAGVGWELSKRLFTWYVTDVSMVDQFYGAMGGFVILAFWAYITALILLFGAEVVSCHARRIAERPVLEVEDQAATVPIPAPPPAQEPAAGAERLAQTGEPT